MDIQVARFREVLGLLKPVVPRKTKLPILTNVLLKDKQAVATDMDTMVIVPVPEADITCLLPYTDMVKMLQYVQGLENLHIEARDGKVAMTWSDGSSSFGTKDAAEFPEVPEFVPVAEASIDVDTLIPAMDDVLGYAATETDRPVLSGVTLILGETVEVAAGDGFRMAYKSLPLKFTQQSVLILPRGSVTALKLLREKTPRNSPVSDSLIPALMAKKQASVAIDGKKGLRFVFGDSATAVIHLIQGEPPAWIKLIPKEEPVLQALVMASQLELAVRRVMRVAVESNGIVRMVFNDSTAIISARHDGQEVESSIRVMSSQGAPTKVGLNANYLLEYLKGKEGIVSISLSQEGAPVAFRHQKDPTVLIMPMLVQW